MIGTALSFTNCSKDLDEAASTTPDLTKGLPFEVYAPLSNSETRFVNAGGDENSYYNNIWAESDGIRVFHADADAPTTYYCNNKFFFAGEEGSEERKQNCADGKFSGLINLDGENHGDPDFDSATKSYKWYAIHPNKTSQFTPENAEGSVEITGYYLVGNAVNSNFPTQNEEKGKMAHISGTNYPIYGKNTTKAGETPSFEMHHTTTLVKVVVTNGLGKDIPANAVNRVTFTAPEDIVGDYYLNITGENPVFTKVSDERVTNKATLNVKNSSLIEDGSKDFYTMGVKPFALDQNDVLYITVTIDGRDYAVKKQYEGEGVKFEAGKVNTVNVTVTEADLVPYNNWTKLTETPTDWSGTYLFVSDDDEQYRAWNGKEEANNYIVLTFDSEGNIATAKTKAGETIPLVDLKSKYAFEMKSFVDSNNDAGYSLSNNAGNYLTPNNNSAGIPFGATEVLAFRPIGNTKFPTGMSVSNGYATLRQMGKTVRFGWHITNDRFNYFPNGKWSDDRADVILYKWVE